MHFFYDAQNKPAVVVFNETAYAYVYNLQGDVIALVDSTGIKVVEYYYNAWGKILDKTGSLASTLGTLNPFRYRGYVFDEETGLYYLRSRYYTPIWQRFVNADQLIQGNIFSYCKNAPISRIDLNGCKDYATIGKGEDIFSLIYSHEKIYGYVSDFLDEQQRIIEKKVPYLWEGASDTAGYSCATFISKPLDKISGKKIKCETGTQTMLRNNRGCFLFIARLTDYSLDKIPIGAIFLRTPGYHGNKRGHAATFAERIDGCTLKINHARNERLGIGSDELTYEDILDRFEYFAWPVGLGTREEPPNAWLVVDEE